MWPETIASTFSLAPATIWPNVESSVTAAYAVAGRTLVDQLDHQVGRTAVAAAVGALELVGVAR